MYLNDVNIKKIDLITTNYKIYFIAATITSLSKVPIIPIKVPHLFLSHLSVCLFIAGGLN